MESDPFDCFGSEEEDSCDNQDIGESNKRLESDAERALVRDEESCGVLAFHANTERSLLMHVKSSVSSSSSDLLPCQQVLREIDWYCSSRHWMMNVGPEKGGIIQKSLQRALDVKLKNGSEKFVAVELGSYCGYGSIFLSSMLKTHTQHYTDVDTKFHIFTVEINPTYASIAREIIQIAEMDKMITVLDNELLMDGSTGNVGNLIQRSLEEKYGNESTGMGIDFLVIDHDKDSYLSDLQLLEKSGLIQAGTTVAADNVIFAEIHEYIDYMKGLARIGVVKTCTQEASVEYSLSEQMLKDGVEITEYIKTPSQC